MRRRQRWLQLIGAERDAAANDKQQIEPMVQAIEQQSGQRPAGILADSGYCSEKNLAYLAATGQSGYPIEAYIATLASKSMTNTASHARADRYPAMRRGSSA